MPRDVPIEPAVSTATWVERAWYGALAVSTLIHLTAIVATSLVPASATLTEEANTSLNSQWTTSEIKTDLTSLEPIVETPLVETELLPGGNESLASTLATEATTPPPISATPLENQPDTPSWMNELARQDDLARVVTPGPSGKSNAHGSGRGNGNGTGDGSGTSSRFFEAEGEGRRCVFVVDGSRSMNHPYPGEYKTRFNRVKMEIGRSIVQMEAESEYFIIFFNDKAHPMPATAFQPAQSETRAKYFEWLAMLSADGLTDPRPALTMALSMRPDVIYFLTDGDFNPVVAQDLESLVQRKVAIHTFSLANPDAEKTLKAVAEHNGGQYTFVP